MKVPSHKLGFPVGNEETETPLLEGKNKILCAPRPRGKEQWSHRRLNQTCLPACSCWRVSCGGVGQQWLAMGTGVLAAALLEGAAWQGPLKAAINTTIQPAGPRAGLPQAKQTTGREHSPTHQQVTGFKFYWISRPCPEQDPVFPIRKLT